MAKTITQLLPQALATLGRRTLPQQASIDRAKRFILAEGWGHTGIETAAEIKTLNEAFEEAARFIGAMSDGLDPYWLTLVGISGTGKTMLAKAIVKYINLYGRTIYNRTIANSFGDQDSRRIYSYAQSGPLFVAWREICPVDKDARGRLSTASSDWFKCVDELKAQVGEKVTVDGEPGIQPKPFEIQACGDLLDERLRKWTVITTNMQRRAIARFWDVRIASRLMRDGAVICDLSDTRDFGIRREIALKNA